MDLNGNREVELVDVAGADQFMDRGDALGVLLLGRGQCACEGIIFGRLEYGGVEIGECGWVACDECACLVIEDVRPLVDAEPG